MARRRGFPDKVVNQQGEMHIYYADAQANSLLHLFWGRACRRGRKPHNEYLLHQLNSHDPLKRLLSGAQTESTHRFQALVLPVGPHSTYNHASSYIEIGIMWIHGSLVTRRCHS